MAKNTWFIIRDGLSTGPFSDKDLRKMAADGALVPETSIKRQGSEKTHKAKSIRGLFRLTPDTSGETINILDSVDTPLPFPESPEGTEPTAIQFIEAPRKWEVFYQGGMPGFTDPTTGTLITNSQAMTFTASGGNSFYFTIDFPSVLELGRPAPGSHLKSTIDKAKSAETLSAATKTIGKFAGGLVGGFGGRLLKTATTAASDMTRGNTKPGPPPKNRMVMLVARDGKRHKVSLEIHRDTQELAEKDTVELWEHLSSLIRKIPVPTVPEPRNPASADNRQPSGGEPLQGSLPAGASVTLFRNGQLVGPLPVFLAAEMFSKGELSPSDHIRVEYWVPASHLPGMIGPMGRVGYPTAGLGLTGPGVGPGFPPGMPPDPKVPGSNPSTPGRQGSGLGYLAAGAVVGAIAAHTLSGREARAHQGIRAGKRRSGREELIDLDGDGTPDGIAIDRDGDGRADVIGLDRDHDGRIDAIAMDTDHDGRIDAVGIDQDGDGDLDAVAMDTDGDGDIDVYGTDSDGDGAFDFFSSDDD